MMVRVVMIVLATAFVVVQTALPASAGGPADVASCVVPKHPRGATIVRGTVNAAVQNATTQGDTDVDFTLRLERGGAVEFFRASVPMQVFASSNEGILCKLLFETTPSTSPAALSLRAAILATFGLPATAKFLLTSTSVSKAETQGEAGQWFCNNTYTDPSLLHGPCSPQRAGSMADVILYVH